MRSILTLSVCSVLALTAAYPAWATSEISAQPKADEPTATAPVENAAEGVASEATAPSAPASEAAPAEEELPEAEHVGVDSSNEEHAASGAHEVIEYPAVDWSFNGVFGTFDRASLQRGFQVYKQVCAACHGLNRLAYRNLAALGYNEGEIKAFAAEATVMDGPNDEGEMYERPGRPADHFKSPFANEEAARYANNGALPPDLSLITRARMDGPNYVHALMTGYREPPAGFTVNPGMHYNAYFAGHQIAMPAPLSEGVVTFEDGTNATVDQMAQDVATFLTWAGDPTMEIRKQTGLKVLIFLSVFSVLMYLTKRKIWKDLH